MSQPGACKIEDATADSCVFFPLFVEENVAIALEDRYRTPPQQARAAGEDRLVLFGEPENMNAGKTFAWFAYAAQAFPWSTHIAKMDLDTFPFMHSLLSRVPSYSEEPQTYQYLGNHHKFGKGRSKSCKQVVQGVLSTCSQLLWPRSSPWRVVGAHRTGMALKTW